ncbi:MAG: hypothetical protein NVS4B6_23720 [Mycobacterium sp.]
MDQQPNVDPPLEPTDARQTTAEQRDLQDKLDHQDSDPDAPGSHLSRHQMADESTR